jgi:hypothetical protein
MELLDGGNLKQLPVFRIEPFSYRMKRSKTSEPVAHRQQACDLPFVFADANPRNWVTRIVVAGSNEGDMQTSPFSRTTS